jgi:hypothetical protein
MWDLARHLRGMAVAVVALAITAGMVLAGGPMPDAATDGLARAAEAAGKVVPVASEPEPANEESDEESDAHGAVVSEAARMETPDGFRNHGHWVSCVARMPHGAGATPIDLDAIDPASCPAPGNGDDEAGPSTGKEQSQGRGRGAERSAAARAAAAARAGR